MQVLLPLCGIRMTAKGNREQGIGNSKEGKRNSLCQPRLPREPSKPHEPREPHEPKEPSEPKEPNLSDGEEALWLAGLQGKIINPSLTLDQVVEFAAEGAAQLKEDNAGMRSGLKIQLLPRELGVSRAIKADPQGAGPAMADRNCVN